MTKQKPIWGIDVHPEFQAGLDFKRAKSEDYTFAVCKASQGASYVPRSFLSYYNDIENSGLIPGLYHFLDSTASGARQADHFINMIELCGGPDGMLLAIDFEHYIGGSPGNQHLLDFVSILRKYVGKHPLILYTNKGFWDSGDSSGNFDQYGADVLWVARYANMVKHFHPAGHYEDILDWDGAWENVGGKDSDFWQFTSTGHVAGQYIDVNAYRRNLSSLQALTESDKKKSKIYEVKLSRRMSHKPTAERVRQQIEERVQLPGNMDVVLVDHSQQGGGKPKRNKVVNGFTLAQHVSNDVRRLQKKFGVADNRLYTYSRNGVHGTRGPELAVDIVTGSWGVDATGRTEQEGWNIFNWVLNEAQAGRIKLDYVIYSGYINNFDGRGTVEYVSDYGSQNNSRITADHDDHVHISWLP